MIYIKYIIKPSPLFEKELEKIYNYITYNLKEPITAKNFYSDVTKQIYSLQSFPERYMKIPTFKNKKRNIRRLPFNKYAIIYEVDNNTRSSLHSTYIS